MKKIILMTIILGISSFFIIDHFDLLASELVEINIDIEEAVAAGYVIQTEDELFNLGRFYEFFENVNRGIDDEVTVVIQGVGFYELAFKEGILRVDEIIETSENGREVRTTQYHSMMKIFRNDKIEFLLVGETKDAFLAHGLTN